MSLAARLAALIQAIGADIKALYAGQSAGLVVGAVQSVAGGVPLPPGWRLADGATLAIADYPALYAAIGTRYGGDGVTTFCLPSLPNRNLPGGQNVGIQAGDIYSLTLASVIVSHTALAGETPASIASALAALVSNHPDYPSQPGALTVAGDTLTITGHSVGVSYTVQADFPSAPVSSQTPATDTTAQVDTITVSAFRYQLYPPLRQIIYCG